MPPAGVAIVLSTDVGDFILREDALRTRAVGAGAAVSIIVSWTTIIVFYCNRSAIVATALLPETTNFS
jgi:hypothetical protein